MEDDYSVFIRSLLILFCLILEGRIFKAFETRNSPFTVSRFGRVDPASLVPLIYIYSTHGAIHRDIWRQPDQLIDCTRVESEGSLYWYVFWEDWDLTRKRVGVVLAQLTQARPR